VSGFLAVLGGFIAAAIPPLAAQTTALVAQAPMYLQSLIDRNSVIGASTNASFLARVGPPMRIDTDDDHDDLRSRERDRGRHADFQHRRSVSTPLSSETTVQNTDRPGKPGRASPKAAGDSRVKPVGVPAGR